MFGALLFGFPVITFLLVLITILLLNTRAMPCAVVSGLLLLVMFSLVGNLSMGGEFGAMVNSRVWGAVGFAVLIGLVYQAIRYSNEIREDKDSSDSNESNEE